MLWRMNNKKPKLSKIRNWLFHTFLVTLAVCPPIFGILCYRAVYLCYIECTTHEKKKTTVSASVKDARVAHNCVAHNSGMVLVPCSNEHSHIDNIGTSHSNHMSDIAVILVELLVIRTYILTLQLLCSSCWFTRNKVSLLETLFADQLPFYCCRCCYSSERNSRRYYLLMGRLVEPNKCGLNLMRNLMWIQYIFLKNKTKQKNITTKNKQEQTRKFAEQIIAHFEKKKTMKFIP